MNPRKFSRPGFTVVELLVVIAIIALLIGITFPALNAMRASARRSTCMNNMRQVAMAVINYESSNQRFPPAAKEWLNPSGASPSKIGHSMYSYLLPYFEEKAVYDQLQFDLHWRDDDTPNDQGRTNKELTHEIYLGGVTVCPAAPSVRRQKYNDGVRQESSQQNQVADYAPAYYLDAKSSASDMSSISMRFRDNGLLSIEPLSALVPDKISDRIRGEPSAWREDSQNQRWWGIMRKQEALNVQDIPEVIVRAAHVRDGLSTTFLLFEVAGRPDQFANGRPVPPELMGTSTQGYFRWGSPALPFRFDEACKGTQILNCHNWREAYAFHKGGAMVSFADGSVEFFKQDADPEVFVSLYTMMGNDVISESKR